MMNSGQLFVTPMPEVLRRAVAIAQEAAQGEIGDAAESAYQAQLDRSLAQTGLSPEELDQLGAPKTWLGRMVERAQDWWWEKTNPDESEPASDLEAAFAFPVPLLQTHPLQDLPFEYDEVDKMMAAAVRDITAEVTQKTDWEPIPFSRPGYDDDEMFDPAQFVMGVWGIRANSSLFVLVEQVDEDPKLMGHGLGLLHLTGERARSFKDQLK